MNVTLSKKSYKRYHLSDKLVEKGNITEKDFIKYFILRSNKTHFKYNCKSFLSSNLFRLNVIYLSSLTDERKRF